MHNFLMVLSMPSDPKDFNNVVRMSFKDLATTEGNMPQDGAKIQITEVSTIEKFLSYKDFEAVTK